MQLGVRSARQRKETERTLVAAGVGIVRLGLTSPSTTQLILRAGRKGVNNELAWKW